VPLGNRGGYYGLVGGQNGAIQIESLKNGSSSDSFFEMKTIK
jgi:hypothetical protein